MADLTHDELEAEILRLKTASADMADILDKQIAFYIREGKNRDDAIKETLSFNKRIEEVHKNYKKTQNEINGTIVKLRKNIDELPIDELGDELTRLRTSIKNTVDQNKKSEMIRAKADIENQYMQRKAADTFKDSLGKSAGALAVGVAGMFTSAAKKAMSGASGFDMAGDVLKSGMDATNAAAQAGASGLSTFGAATMGAGGKVGKLGIAATIAGAGISMLGNSMTDLAKEGVSFLLRETQKSITNFQLLNATGATFAEGMKTMRSYATESGLTLEQFSKVVSSNSTMMADAGMTATESAKAIASVGKSFKANGNEMQKQMLAMGYSFEEQSTMSAKVMANMNRGLGKTRATDDQVAQATMSYAANLKLLSDLTGAEGKSRAEKVANDNTILAFEAEKDKMSATQRKELDNAMAKMTDQEQQNLRERMIFGRVINKNGAVMEAMNSGAEKQGKDYYKRLKANELSVETVADIQARHGRETYGVAMQLSKTIGLSGAVGNASGVEMSKGQGDLLKNARATTPEALAEIAAAAVEAKANAATAGTDTNSIIEAQIESQKALITVEELAAKNLGEFNVVLKNAMGMLETTVTKGIAAAVANTTASNPTLMSGISIALNAIALALPLLIAKGGFGGDGGGGGRGGRNRGGRGAGGNNRVNIGGGKILKVGGAAGVVGGIVLDAAADNQKEKGNLKTGAALGVGSTALSGASTGALLGSVVPGLGTAIGAGIGGALGAAYGVYQNWDDIWAKEEEVKDEAVKNTKVEAAITSKNVAVANKDALTTLSFDESVVMFADAIKLFDDIAIATYGIHGGGARSVDQNATVADRRRAREEANADKKEEAKAEEKREVAANAVTRDSSTRAQIEASEKTSANAKETKSEGKDKKQEPIPSGVAGMLEQIARGEGTDDVSARKKGLKSGYDVSLGYGKFGDAKGKVLSEMNFGEVKAYQKTMLRDPKNKFNSSAVGKMQLISSTLREQQKKGGFKDTDLFDAAAQDKIGLQLLKERGLDKFQAGKINANQLQDRLAGTWASVANSRTGKSTYGQHTGTSTAQIQTAISGLNDSVKDLTDKNAIAKAMVPPGFVSTEQAAAKEKEIATAKAMVPPGFVSTEQDAAKEKEIATAKAMVPPGFVSTEQAAAKEKEIATAKATSIDKSPANLVRKQDALVADVEEKKAKADEVRAAREAAEIQRQENNPQMKSLQDAMGDQISATKEHISIAQDQKSIADKTRKSLA